MLEDVTVQCPHCWETITLEIDLSVPEQSYVEDCPVCCAPILVNCRVEDGEIAHVTVDRENG